jgi:hypothetical protein
MKTFFKAGCMLAIGLALFTSCSKEGWAPIDLIDSPHYMDGNSRKHLYNGPGSVNSQPDHHEIYVLKNQFEVSDSTRAAKAN